jgi:hypothetical protein
VLKIRKGSPSGPQYEAIYATLRISAKLTEREQAAKEKLVRESGVPYVLDELQGLLAAIHDINSRSARDAAVRSIGCPRRWQDPANPDEGSHAS